MSSNTLVSLQVNKFLKKQQEKDEEPLPFDENELDCPTCDKTFKSNTALEGHYDKFHKGKTKYR